MNAMQADLPSATTREPSDALPVSLGAAYIGDLLDRMRRTEPAAYALLEHLPEQRFAIVRYFDEVRYRFGDDDPRSEDHYTVRAFYRALSSFHPQDRFRILFGDEVLTCPRECTVERLYSLCASYVATCCRRGLRENRPVCLTPGLIRLYGLSAREATTAADRVAECNARAQAEIQAEYDALKCLDCLKR